MPLTTRGSISAVSRLYLGYTPPMVIHPTRGSIPEKRAPSASICRTWSVHQRRLVGPLTRWREERAWWAQLSHRAPPCPCGPEHQARLDLEEG